MDCMAKRNDLLGEQVVKKLQARHFDACYCPDKATAVAKVLSLIGTGETVTWGGMMTLRESGLFDALQNHPCTVLDRDTVAKEARSDAMRQAFFADTYLMSANAIAATGELVNIDGTGNRVAALCYGPKQVVVLAGMNKVAPTLEDAVTRARNVAAPVNAQRFDISTPCKATGACADCLCTDSICAQFVITRICRPAGRIKVVLCGESMGF